MKSQWLVGLSLFAWAASVWFRHSGQAAPEGASHDVNVGANVAVVDMGKIFNHHPAFRREMAKLKREASVYDTIVRTNRAKLDSDDKKLKSLAKSEGERAILRRKVATGRVELQQDITEKTDDLLKREAHLYADTYEDIHQEIGVFVAKKGIRLVVRYNSEKIDREDREGVRAAVNRDVIFQDGLDITGDILRIITNKDKARRPDNG